MIFFKDIFINVIFRKSCIMWYAFYWILHRKHNFRQIYTNSCVFSIYSNVI